MAFNRTLQHFTSSQELATVWASSQSYILNQLVIEGDKLYRCNSAHTSISFQTDYASGKWLEVSDGLTPWATGRYYEQDQFVEESNSLYRCLVAHTSGTFATDLTGGKWVSLLPTTTAGDIIVHNGTDNVRQAIGSDGQVLVVDSAQTNKLKWATIQQGSKNYIANSTFENGVTPPSSWFSAYASLSAGTKVPIGNITLEGSGSETFALTTSNSSPLAGTYSMVATRSGSLLITGSARGFVSSAFTIDKEDQAKVMAFSFYYEASGTNLNFSGTSDNTFAIYIAEVNPSSPETVISWIQPAGVYNMTQGTGVGLASGTFQTTATGTSYRLAVFAINTITGGSSIKFDDFQVGPQKVVYGSPVTDWQDYTPTLTNFTVAGTNALNEGKWRRVGDSVEVQITTRMGSTGTGSTTPGSDVFYWSIPTGLTIDLNKTTSTTSGVRNAPGSGLWYDRSANIFKGITPSINPSGLGIWATVEGTVDQVNGISSPTNSDDSFSISMLLPVTGWSSSVQMSNDTDTRVISAQASCSTAFAYSDTTPINFDTVVVDRAGAVTTSATAWKFTAPVSGDYRVSTNLLNGTGSISVNLYKNGSLFRQLMSVTTAAITSASTTISLNAGDYIDIRGASAATLVAGSTTNTISIERLSGPATIAASETVALSRSSSVIRSIPAYASPNFYTAYLDFDFSTGLPDTHKAWRSGVGYNSTTGAWTTSPAFVVPVSGIYKVSFRVLYGTTAGYKQFFLHKNGSTFAATADDTTSSASAPLSFDGQVQCNAGDLIQVLAVVANTQNVPVSVSSFWSGIDIFKV